MKEKLPLDLRVSRVRSGLSNRDLAHLLDCNQERVSKLEHGKARISGIELITLSLIYGQSCELTFRQTVYGLLDQVKKQLASMPAMAANWSKHAANRTDTINGLAHRLQEIQGRYNAA